MVSLKQELKSCRRLLQQQQQQQQQQGLDEVSAGCSAKSWAKEDMQSSVKYLSYAVSLANEAEEEGTCV